MVWECNNCTSCECGEASNQIKLKGKIDLLRHRKSIFRVEALDCWIRLAQLYPTLKLTKAFDRPYALAGIATHFSRVPTLDSNYIARMWLTDLPRSLLWTPSTPQDPTKPYTLTNMRKRIKGNGNSWSWMAQYDTKRGNCNTSYPQLDDFV